MPDTNLKYLQEQWKIAPDSEAFYPLAGAYYDLGLHDAAADVLQQGLRHHPNHAKGLTLLGQIQHQRGESDEARDTFNRALNADATSSYPLCGLAQLDIAAGNCARAETWLKQAESFGETSWTEKLREELERKQDIASEGEAELPFVSETMVDLYLKQGMKEKAVAALRQLAAQNPEDSSLRQRLNELLPHAASADESGDRASDIEARLNAWLRAVEQRKQRR